MRILARKTLIAYAESRRAHSDHRALKAALDAWFAEVSRAEWQSSAELKEHYASASVVGDRVVFNVKGNDYRLVVAMDYERQVAFIKWVGTHREYDAIDVRTVRYGD